MNAATTRTADRSTARASSLLASLAAMLIGGAIVYVAGHAQAATLHDAAHDVRHATGFPCH